MKFISLESIFYSKKIQNAKWITLNEDSILCGIPFAKGSQYKAFETRDAGYVVFKPGTKCPNGDSPGRLWFRW